jgi:hypothetical protein
LTKIRPKTKKNKNEKKRCRTESLCSCNFEHFQLRCAVAFIEPIAHCLVREIVKYSFADVELLDRNAHSVIRGKRFEQLKHADLDHVSATEQQSLQRMTESRQALGEIKPTAVFDFRVCEIHML